MSMYKDEFHPCEHPGCDNTVGFDDEPFCFIHSPDSGSFVPGYSYKEQQARKAAESEGVANTEK